MLRGCGAGLVGTESEGESRGCEGAGELLKSWYSIWENWEGTTWGVFSCGVSGKEKEEKLTFIERLLGRKRL